jgi:TonB-linked SusC/RagA family outer membrane protein
MLLASLSATAQNITVRGTVVDGNGESIIGASVRLKGNDAMGTITDFDGHFTLSNVPVGSTIVVSFIGMQTQEVRTTSSGNLKITMAEDSELLDEVVVVGFGQQKKESVVGAIAQTTAKVLERTGGVSSLGQALTGNLPGVVTMTTTGKPGEEDPQITIRGVSSWNNSDPLILVDGIERPMSGVDINSVATISVLKDASATAVFGVRGANGVILITTKRGAEGRANININASTTLKTYSKLPELMDAYDSYKLRNTVIEHELGTAPNGWSYYQPQAIMNKYRYPANLEEFERYPNVDWVDELLKDVAMSYNANVNVSGGTSFVKYFASVDYQHEGDIYKKIDSGRGYQPGFVYDRINVRSNLDFDLTKTTKLHVNLSGSHAVSKGRGMTYSGDGENLVWAAFYGIAPDAFRPRYSDGTFGYYRPQPTQAAQNSMESLAVSGISYNTVDRLNTDFTLEQDLSFITKGLSIQGRLAFDNAFQEANRGVDDMNDNEANLHKWIDPDTGQSYTDVTIDAVNRWDFKNNNAWAASAGAMNDWATYRRTNYSLQLNYARTFGLHSVGAMGNFSREEFATGSMEPFYRENWVFRATYDYGKRYLLEYNGAYNGSEKFAPEYRFAFFQSGALGWVVTEEPWFKKLNLKWIDYLKFRGSYGEIGDDNINGRWLFMDTWSYGGAIWQGLDGEWGNRATSPYQYYQQSQVGNPNVRWEVATKMDVAMEFGFLGIFTGSVDFFSEKRKDILLAGADRSVPSYYGATAPTANLGQVDSKGYEIELRWNKMLNRDWRLWGNASYTHATNKVKFADDPQLMPDYQKTAGKAINQTNSYVDKGYYNNWDELYGSTSHDGLDENRMPGNYLILDYDADGIISTFDNIPYGFTGVPQNTLNAQIGVDWKGWSFFVQFYGVNNVTRYVGLTSLGGIRNTAFDEGSYWSKDNMNADVPLPRWNAQASAFTNGTRYLYDGSYLRLKYAELSYTFDNSSWIKKIGLNSLKLFANGNNLFLWTKMPDDRESNTGGNTAYPTPRRYNLGLRITL